MNDISSERIEPTGRVVEPQGPEPRGQPEAGSQRRRPPQAEESERAEESEAPVHQVDRLV